MRNLYMLLSDLTSNDPENAKDFIDNLSVFDYVLDIVVMLTVLCAVTYLSFSIVKKRQLDEGKIESDEQENSKINQKIMIKNQIEIIQSGIVSTDSNCFIIPQRRVISNHIFDENCPKIRHLCSTNYDIYHNFKHEDEFNEVEKLIEETNSAANESSNTQNLDSNEQ